MNDWKDPLYWIPRVSCVVVTLVLAACMVGAIWLADHTGDKILSFTQQAGEAHADALDLRGTPGDAITPTGDEHLACWRVCVAVGSSLTDTRVQGEALFCHCVHAERRPPVFVDEIPDAYEALSVRARARARTRGRAL